MGENTSLAFTAPNTNISSTLSRILQEALSVLDDADELMDFGGTETMEGSSATFPFLPDPSNPFKSSQDSTRNQ